MLRSGRIAGLMEFKGEILGPAAWPPIITPAQRDKVLALMESRKASGRRSPRRYLLSSLVRCGKCGVTLKSAATVDRRRYVCVAGPDHDGCGGIMVTAGPLEQLIADAVLYRLDTPELAEALRGRSDDDSLAVRLSDDIAADRAQLDELAQLYAERAIPAREWVAARRPIEDRVTGAERRLARLTRSDSLAGLIGNGEQLRGSWSELNLTRQAAIVAAVLDHVIIKPAVPGFQTLDPNRVEAIWRL